MRSENSLSTSVLETNMKKLCNCVFATLVALAIGLIGGGIPAYGLPFDGSSVSISSAQFTFNATGDLDVFTTAVEGSTASQTSYSTGGVNSVTAIFFDENGALVNLFLNAKLNVTAIDFTAGLSAGTGGSFAILTSDDTLLLSGNFGASGSSLTSSGTNGAEFMSSIIVDFINSQLIGTTFSPPGLFSATLGDIGTLSLDNSFTSTASATTTVQGSLPVPAPEPTSLLLLGSGLAVLGLLGRKKHKGISS